VTVSYARAMKIILTGATGMVGEAVLLECLRANDVEKVLVLARKPSGHTHPKLEEMIVGDFLKLESSDRLRGYDACFYCAGVSSVGMSEADYTRITFDTPLHVAKVLADERMVFVHVSGASTDGTEKGRVMWARVKGRTENALMKLPFRGVYNFRPGLMKPVNGQQNIKTSYRVGLVLLPVLGLFLPVLTLTEVANAMLNCVRRGAPKHVLEVADIKAMAS
jgi:uncharacterized protein YbjT (DUF2867 family)